MPKTRLLVAAFVLAGCSSSTDRSAEPGAPQTPLGTDSVLDQAPSVGQSAAVARLERETGERWSVAVHKTLGTPSHLEGRTAPMLRGSADAFDVTLGFFERHGAIYSMKAPRAELSAKLVARDELGMTHVRMQQHVRGIPVRGAELYAHYRSDGSLATIDARYVPNLDALDTTPALTADRAVEAAIADATKSVEGFANAKASSAALAVHAPDNAPAALGYELTVRASGKAREVLLRYTIDAKTGAVLNVYDDIQEIAGSGTGVLGDVKNPLQVSQSGASYTLVDTTRASGSIRTNNAGQQQTLPGSQITSSSMTTWDKAAVDAHFYAGVVYDFYSQKLQRNAINGAGGQMLSTVHYGQSYNNAFWDPQQLQMAYGDGDGSNFRIFSAGLDVVGHELTHGVTSNTSDLAYQNASGALNEGMSDVFGALIEHFYKPDPVKNFTMGEGIVLGSVGLRDYIHPSTGQQPSNMAQYQNTTQDNGGVHTNSGIINNSWYLMTIGGTNDYSKTKVGYGIGWDKSAQVWYRTNSRYLTSSSDFAACARGTLSAATDLALTDNEKAIIECAWIATGVLSGSCKTIVDPAPAPPPPSGNGNNNGGTSSGSTQSNGDTSGDPANDTPANDGSSSSSGGSRGYRPSNVQATGCNVAHGTTGDAASFGVLLGLAALAAKRRRK